MLKDIIFHTLRGVDGWSSFNRSIIDVARVVSITYHKREFKIYDTDHNYTLTIEYEQPEDEIKIVYVKNGFGVTHGTKTLHMLTKRYVTEIDVLNEIREIEEKQKKLEKIRENFVNMVDKIHQQ
jgi:hypothetical protein